MSSLKKALEILDLFKNDCISIQYDDAEQFLQASRTTTYRYLRELCDAGLLSPASGGRYVLGPRIIALDRQMRRNDPLLTAGREVMSQVAQAHGFNMLLTSYFRDSAMCVDIVWPDQSIAPHYERGRPMSLLKGAMAKVILANLSTYQQKNIALAQSEQIRLAGLGDDWKSFRSALTKIKKAGYCLTLGELTPESIGISAPIFESEGNVVGSITFAIPNAKFTQKKEAHYAELIMDSAHKITKKMAQASPQFSPTH